MISIRNAAKPVRHNQTSVRSNMFAHRRMYVNIPLYSGDEENMAKTNVHVRWESKCTRRYIQIQGWNCWQMCGEINYIYLGLMEFTNRKYFTPVNTLYP